jgi:1,5-anhydro-D-fructose reductase (1,5-anhydro-D-mannitol-forming)
MRIALLGFWHVHAMDYAEEAAAHPDAEIVAAWDEDHSRGEARAAKLGVPFADDLDALLARSDIDGVVVTTRTNSHPAVIGAAAAAGKHVFTEKVLALTPNEADEIVEAVDRAGVTLVVSLPRLAHGYTTAIRAVLAEGTLGEVTEVRCRLAHDGALRPVWLPEWFFDRREAGGGALVDLGCHPLYLTRLFLGRMPVAVTAAYGHVTGRAVEDNAVVTLHDPTGAIGVAETGFVTPASPFSVEIHGTAGSLLFGTPEPRLLVGTAGDGERSWAERSVPGDGPTPFEQWVRHVRDGTVATENVALALDLTRLVDAADRAAASGKAVAVEAGSGR